MSGPGGSIEFYFEFSSPYGYIATQLAEDFEKRVGRPMQWRPILLGPIFKVTGQAPLVDIPLKGAYAKRDFLRTARMHNVTYNQPSKFPIGTVAAARAFYWLDDRDPQKARELAKALYKAYFVDDIDIGPAATVVEIAKSIGVDGAELAAALEDPAVKERVKNEVDAAIKKEVFGSPFFIIEGEPFWGVDRMAMLAWWTNSKDG
jgi:2-hydroxychromene-2-carboxylate isomerase